MEYEKVLCASEEFVNETQGCRFGDSEPQETFTDNVGRLFKFLQKEYGRCQSKVYIDTLSGVREIGWVFQKRVQYSDCKETYLQSTWITLFDGDKEVSGSEGYYIPYPKIKNLEYHYLDDPDKLNITKRLDELKQ